MRRRSSPPHVVPSKVTPWKDLTKGPLMIEVAAVGALLAPALPYLLKSADHVATQAADALGGTAWEFAQRVWAKVGGRLEERPAGRVAIEEVAASPADEGPRYLLDHELRKVLDADPGLAAELEEVMRAAQQAGVEIRVAGDRNVTAVDTTITNSSIVAGDRNIQRKD